MRRCSPEIEAIIPRISPQHFTPDKSARLLESSADTHMNMMELNGSWKIVGWALADDVAPRDMCKYVILCERDDERLWCHIAYTSLEKIADKINKDSTKVASL